MSERNKTLEEILNNEKGDVVKKKFDILNNNYPIENYSVSRFILSLILGMHKGIKFNKDEAKIINELIRYKIDENFNNLIVYKYDNFIKKINSDLGKKSKKFELKKFNEIKLEDYLIQDEFELLGKIKDNISRSFYPRKIKNKIFNYENNNTFQRGKNNKINVYLIPVKDLVKNKYIKEKDIVKEIGLRGVMFSKKTNLSILYKTLSKISDFYGNEPNYEKTTEEYILTNIEKCLTSGQGLESYFLSKEFQKSKKKLKDKIYKEFLDSLQDFFFVDTARMKLITNNDSIKYIDGRINDGIYDINEINFKSENKYKNKVGDNSITHSFSRKIGKLNYYGEIKVQNLTNFLICGFDDKEKSHIKYKENIKRKIREKIKQDKKFEKISEYLSMIFNVNKI